MPMVAASANEGCVYEQDDHGLAREADPAVLAKSNSFIINVV